ncbi:hypothetical protein BC628DRAFT_148232 [Trametes gibbosa]|nr:hypothetical protein BC628DRAFT_148232 [Trametes gibbosa]
MRQPLVQILGRSEASQFAGFLRLAALHLHFRGHGADSCIHALVTSDRTAGATATRRSLPIAATRRSSGHTTHLHLISRDEGFPLLFLSRPPSLLRVQSERCDSSPTSSECRTCPHEAPAGLAEVIRTAACCLIRCVPTTVQITRRRLVRLAGRTGTPLRAEGGFRWDGQRCLCGVGVGYGQGGRNGRALGPLCLQRSDPELLWRRCSDASLLEKIRAGGGT